MPWARCAQLLGGLPDVARSSASRALAWSASCSASSQAMLTLIARAASRCWAPSWRLRSIRRRSESAAATIRVREAWSSAAWRRSCAAEAAMMDATTASTGSAHIQLATPRATQRSSTPDSAHSSGARARTAWAHGSGHPAAGVLAAGSAAGWGLGGGGIWCIATSLRRSARRDIGRNSYSGGRELTTAGGPGSAGIDYPGGVPERAFDTAGPGTDRNWRRKPWRTPVVHGGEDVKLLMWRMGRDRRRSWGGQRSLTPCRPPTRARRRASRNCC